MRSALVVVGLLVGTACGVDRGEPFREGLPTTDQVTMKLPQGTSKSPLTGQGTRRDGLEGETALFYGVTRGVTVVVNGGAVLTLGLVDRIVHYPPTSVAGNTATWGPHTDALSPNTWRLTVTRESEDHFSYELQGKGKTQGDDAFRTVLSGSHVRTGHQLGSGSFVIDWDTARTLPEHDRNVGRASYQYSHVASTAEISIDATFNDVRDEDTGLLIDASYQYREQPDQSGTLDFLAKKDVVRGSAVEDLSVKSRWQPTGAGRSDVRVSSGDLTAPATASECWDSGFLSRYFNTSFDAAQNYGDASSCAFSTAEYSRL